MKQIDTLIFDAIIKLRNNKKQPNKYSIHTLISKDCKSLSKKQKTLTKENKIINRPSAGKNFQDEIIYVLMGLKNGKKNLGWIQSKI